MKNYFSKIKNNLTKIKDSILSSFSRVLTKIKESFKNNKLINKIKNNNSYKSTKKILTNKTLIKTFLAVFCAAILLTQSFAWMYDEYIGAGSQITMGTIYHSIAQYDSDGELLNDSNGTQSVIYESNMSTAVRESKFIAVTNTGTLDMEYSITFSLEGTLNTTGIFFYRFYEVTSGVLETQAGTYDTKLEAYAAANPMPANIESDTSIPVQNMSLINNSVVIDSIYKNVANPENNTRYYRLDYGNYSWVTTGQYSGQSFSVHFDVYSSQIGVISQENRVGQVWDVQTEAQLIEIMNSVMADDTIRLIDDINLTGSLNFSKRVNLDLNGKTLNVSGDVIYDFVSTGDMLIDVTDSGKLIVGNDFTINTPKTEVTLEGSNYNYDIVVGGRFVINTLQDGEADGCYIDDTRIVKSINSLVPADVTLLSNTRLTIGPDVVLGIISAYQDSTNIEVVNNGNITRVDFSQMDLQATYTKYQIYLYNLGQIYGVMGEAGVLLPPESTPYIGPNDGNTLIVKGITSGDFTVSGSPNFDETDIEDPSSDISVVPIEGEDNAYIVYIKDSTVSIQSLLEAYFYEHGMNISNSISSIEKMVVYTLNAQFVENEDFDYIKSNAMYNIEYLDLSNARVIDGTTENKIKNDALNNKTSLKTVLLPKQVTEIGDRAFYNLNLGDIPLLASDPFNFVTIPNSVTSIGASAFNTSTYIKFKAVIPPTIGTGAFNATTARFFLPDETYDSYIAAGLPENHLYQTAFLSDDRNYFIYETTLGVGISYKVNNLLTGNLGIPSTLGFRGTTENVTEIGINSYRGLNIMLTDGATVTLPNTVTSIREKAFRDLNIISIPLTNVQTIGAYAFYDTNINIVTATNATTIGDYAFYSTLTTEVSLTAINSIGIHAFENSPNLYVISLGPVNVIGDYAFYNCPNVVKVFFGTTESHFSNNSEVINIDLGENAVFNDWGSYIDDRLRVYVPVGSTDNGNSYLSLYNNLFGYTHSNFVFITGTEIGSYTHYTGGYQLSQYTVREVTLTRYNGATRTGLEIISYQGADLTADIPKTLTYNGTSVNVISIGPNAFRNAVITPTNGIKLDIPLLINVGNYAFYNKKINRVTIPDAVSIGISAFENTIVKTVELNNLLTLSGRAFYGCQNLYRVKLGNVTTIGELALANTPNLSSVFIDNVNTNVNYNSDAFTNAGTNLNNRFRMYVPDTNNLVTFYKGIFPDWSTYIYPTGIIVGHYLFGANDIGAYSVRQVTYNDAVGTATNGYEIIEYHGADLDGDFTLPSTLLPNSDTLDVEYTVTSGLGGHDTHVSVTMTNTGTQNITGWYVNMERIGDIYGLSGAGVLVTNNTGYITFYNSSSNGSISAGSSRTVTFHFKSTNTLITNENLNYLSSSTVVSGAQSFNIISVGSNAFMHTTVAAGSTFNLEATGILHVGISAFENMIGIRHVTMNNVVILESAAFKNTTITQGSFANLNDVESEAFANCNNLYIINLGKVQTMRASSITNAPYLYQVRFDVPSTVSLEIASNVFSAIGTATHDRMRFYVTNGTTSGESNVNIYSDHFPAAYKDYFYAYDYIVGTYNPAGLIETIDIGQYSVKNQTIGVSAGYEFVEYHGENIDSSYEFPTTLDLNDRYLQASANVTGAWGTYTHSVTVTVTNTGPATLNTWKVVINFADAGTITAISADNTTVTQNGNVLTLVDGGWNSQLTSGQSREVVVRITHDTPQITGTVMSVRQNTPSANAQNVISIGDFAYTHATFNSGITFDIISDNLIKIGESAFENNTGIRNVEAKNCTIVSDNAFKNATGLRTAIFSKLTTLGTSALQGDTNLIVVDLGTVATIGDNALSGDIKIARIIFRRTAITGGGEAAITVGSNVFSNVGTFAGERFRIYVPEGQPSNSTTTYLQAYKAKFTDYAAYIYEIGFIYGTNLYDGNTFNIGAMALRKVISNGTTGWELIEYHGADINEDFNIPNESITYNEETYQIVSLGKNSFILAQKVANYTWALIIPSNIVNIEERAFYQMPISTITSSARMNYIGKYAFAETNTLTSINIGEVTLIDEYAFYLNNRLSVVRLGENIEEIGDYAFYNPRATNQLNSFYILTVTPPTIYIHTLPERRRERYDSQNRPYVYVPYDYTEPYGSATYWQWYPQDWLDSWYGNYVYEIINGNEINLLDYYGNDTNVIVPDTWTINNQTYYITKIEYDCYVWVNRLRTVTLGRYVRNVSNNFMPKMPNGYGGNYAVNLTNIYVPTTNNYFSSINGVLFDKSGETLIRYPLGKTGSTYTLPASTRVIAEDAFKDNTRISTINLNSSLIAIAANAFTNSNISIYNFNSTTPPYLMGFEQFNVVNGFRFNFPLDNGLDNYTNEVYYNWYSNYLYGS